MAMAKFTVDGPNLLLIAKAGVTNVDVKIDLYSDAKEHWLTTVDMKFNFPLRVIGGDPIGGGKFAGDLYFLTNGWKIRPDEADHTLTFDGNLFLDEGETGSIIVPTIGAFTVLATIERSADVRLLDAASGAPTVDQIADGIWDELLADHTTAGTMGKRLRDGLTLGQWLGLKD